MWAFRSSDAEGFDAFLPDCVLDPAIDAQGIARPVLGLSHLTATFLAAQGATVGALARNQAIADELDRRLASYSVKREPTLVMDLSFEDIADDETWRRAVETHAGRLACDFALNACSAVELGSPSTNTVVVDPTALALRLLGTARRADRDGRVERDRHRRPGPQSSPARAAASREHCERPSSGSRSSSSRSTSTTPRATTPPCRRRWCRVPARVGSERPGSRAAPTSSSPTSTRRPRARPTRCSREPLRR